jgi:hypothetical protein
LDFFVHLDRIEALPAGGKDLTHIKGVFDEYCKIFAELSAYKE